MTEEKKPVEIEEEVVAEENVPDEPKKEEVVAEEKPVLSVQDALNKAAHIAATLPAHAGKSAKQHGTDIANRIRDLLK